MIFTRICRLIAGMLTTSTCITRLRYRIRSIIFGWRCLFNLFFSWNWTNRLVVSRFRIISFSITIGIIIISFLSSIFLRNSGRWISCFLLIFYQTIDSSQLCYTRLIKLSLLTTFSTCINLLYDNCTGELWG